MGGRILFFNCIAIRLISNLYCSFFLLSSSIFIFTNLFWLFWFKVESTKGLLKEKLISILFEVLGLASSGIFDFLRITSVTTVKCSWLFEFGLFGSKIFVRTISFCSSVFNMETWLIGEIWGLSAMLEFWWLDWEKSCEVGLNWFEEVWKFWFIFLLF